MMKPNKPSNKTLATYGKAWTEHKAYRKVESGIKTKRGVVFKDYAEIGKILWQTGLIKLNKK